MCIARPFSAWGLLVAALAGLIVSSAGCGNVQPGVPRWDDDGSAAGSVRVVIAPLNLAVRLALDLEEAVEPVEAEIIRYFQSHGAKVAVIWPADARWLWGDSMLAIQGSESPASDLEAAAGVFVRALVFTPEGRRVFQGWGGIDLVHDAVLVKGGNSERSFLRLQQQLIENPEHVREGVALALEQDVFARPK